MHGCVNEESYLIYISRMGDRAVWFQMEFVDIVDVRSECINLQLDMLGPFSTHREIQYEIDKSLDRDYLGTQVP